MSCLTRFHSPYRADLANDSHLPRPQYRSTWAHEGKSGYYGLTQFEPTAARRAYPGWDEPNLKATYTFRMIHRKDTVALANMPATSTKPIAGPADEEKLLKAKELGLKIAQEEEGSKGKVEAKTEGKTEGKTEAASDEWVVTEYETTVSLLDRFPGRRPSAPYASGNLKVLGPILVRLTCLFASPPLLSPTAQSQQVSASIRVALRVPIR